MKECHKNGKISYGISFKGKTNSIETKNKMSVKAKEKIGDKNSSFGTYWIYNIDLNENKKIKKEELDSYLKLNWIKGRKMNF